MNSELKKVFFTIGFELLYNLSNIERTGELMFRIMFFQKIHPKAFSRISLLYLPKT